MHVSERVANFVCIFTVDGFCFISEAISTRKNACFRKGGQFCIHFYGISVLFYIRGKIYSGFVCALATVDVVPCFTVLSCVKL